MIQLNNDNHVFVKLIIHIYYCISMYTIINWEHETQVLNFINMETYLYNPINQHVNWNGIKKHSDLWFFFNKES